MFSIKKTVDADTFTAVCETGGVKIGRGAINVSSAEITEMYVEPDYRRQSYGGAILGALELYASGAGLVELSVMPLDGSSGFFRARGYSPEPDSGQNKSARAKLTRVVGMSRCNSCTQNTVDQDSDS